MRTAKRSRREKIRPEEFNKIEIHELSKKNGGGANVYLRVFAKYENFDKNVLLMNRYLGSEANGTQEDFLELRHKSQRKRKRVKIR